MEKWSIDKYARIIGEVDEARTAKGDWSTLMWAGQTFRDDPKEAYGDVMKWICGNGTIWPITLPEAVKDPSWSGYPDKMSQLICLVNGSQNQRFISYAPIMAMLVLELHAKLRKAYEYLDNLACGFEVDLGELSGVMDDIRTDVPPEFEHPTRDSNHKEEA